MTRRMLAAIALTTLALPGLARAEGADDPLDVSAIARIVVTGEASRIRLTTNKDDAFQATLESTPKGGGLARWQSSWFVDDCVPAGTMRMQDHTLFVDVPSSSAFDFSDCTVELTANVPPGASISIDQQALMASLAGDYASVTVRSHAGDISLVGSATAVDLDVEAMRIRLEFDGKRTVETVRIAGKAMDASLKFAAGTQIQYHVDATASFVDSTLSNTPDAQSSVLITGELVCATIR